MQRKKNILLLFKTHLAFIFSIWRCTGKHKDRVSQISVFSLTYINWYGRSENILRVANAPVCDILCFFSFLYVLTYSSHALHCFFSLHLKHSARPCRALFNNRKRRKKILILFSFIPFLFHASPQYLRLSVAYWWRKKETLFCHNRCISLHTIFLYSLLSSFNHIFFYSFILLFSIVIVYRFILIFPIILIFLSSFLFFKKRILILCYCENRFKFFSFFFKTNFIYTTIIFHDCFKLEKFFFLIFLCKKEMISAKKNFMQTNKNVNFIHESFVLLSFIQKLFK